MIDSEHSLEMRVIYCYTIQKCRRKPSGDQQVLQKPHILFRNMGDDIPGCW